MKQKQYAPMSVAQQAVVIFAAEKGFLQDVEIKKVVDFEASLLAYADSEGRELMAKINVKGDYNAEIESELKALLENFLATQTW
jgi:F-type H+-transporting ATPase subunit alpha